MFLWKFFETYVLLPKVTALGQYLSFLLSYLIPQNLLFWGQRIYQMLFKIYHSSYLKLKRLASKKLFYSQFILCYRNQFFARFKLKIFYLEKFVNHADNLSLLVEIVLPQSSEIKLSMLSRRRQLFFTFYLILNSV